MHRLTFPFVFAVTTTAETHSVGVATFRITPIFDNLSNSCFRSSLRAIGTLRVGSWTGWIFLSISRGELSIQSALSCEHILVLRHVVFHLRTFTLHAFQVHCMNILFFFQLAIEYVHWLSNPEWIPCSINSKKLSAVPFIVLWVNDLESFLAQRFSF